MMFLKPMSRKAGLPPGALVHIGEKRTEKIKVTRIAFEGDALEEISAEALQDDLLPRNGPGISWLNVDGVHDENVIERIGKHLGLHPLTMEDILNTGQRPKMEDYGQYVFIVLKMITCPPKQMDMEVEQVSLVLGPGYLLSFQEREGDVFSPIRERIRNEKSRLRQQGADYLAYALMDAVVDNYFGVMEEMDSKLESIEEELLENPTPETLQKIHQLKRSVIFLQKAVWPLREAVSALERTESPLISDVTHQYIRDVYDHTIQVIDVIETFKDMLSGMVDTYLSNVSNRMNEVMKVLTVISTIFIPLTFIAGIYGMNFDNMPELHWPWGYFASLGLMGLISVLMIIFFKKKKWL